MDSPLIRLLVNLGRGQGLRRFACLHHSRNPNKLCSIKRLSLPRLPGSPPGHYTYSGEACKTVFVDRGQGAGTEAFSPYTAAICPVPSPPQLPASLRIVSTCCPLVITLILAQFRCGCGYCCCPSRSRSPSATTSLSDKSSA